MKSEAKVGLLVVASFLLVLFFAYLMGFVTPIGGAQEIHVMYNFAGGIEEGSPVRVMGIKVGKVKRISFDPDFKMAGGEEVKLRVTVQINKSAWGSIRKDSKYFINLAGVIGEKFLEISPGSSQSEQLQDGEVVRGEDPPRIDQLISQSYGLAGKVIELVEKNEGSVVNIINQLDKLTTNVNKTLVLMEKVSQDKEASRLIKNAIQISDDLAYLTNKMRSEKAEKTYDLLHRLLFRLEPLDEKAIRKFLQEEGVKARVGI